MNKEKAENQKLKSKLRLLESKIAIAKSLEDPGAARKVEVLEEQIKITKERIEELKTQIEAQDTKWHKNYQSIFAEIKEQIEKRALEWPQSRVEKLTMEVTQSKIRLDMLEKKAQIEQKQSSPQNIHIEDVHLAATNDYNLK